MTELTVARDELGTLYAELSPQLRRVLGTHLQAPEWVIDDACQMAWEALLSRPVALERSQLLGWLATTARRKALRLMKRGDAEICLDASGYPEVTCDVGADPQRTVEFWERVGSLRRLSRLEQQCVWLSSLGYGRTEIATSTGTTPRTVRRQLAEARRQLREAGCDAA